MPYHSEYLAGATETLIEEDLEGEELWSAKGIKIPVYNTKDGVFNGFLLIYGLNAPFRFRYAQYQIFHHLFALRTNLYLTNPLD